MWLVNRTVREEKKETDRERAARNRRALAKQREREREKVRDAIRQGWDAEVRNRAGKGERCIARRQAVR